MDFLTSIQKKYIPSIHKFRYDQRKSRVNSLKQKCMNNPQQLSYEEVRVILRVFQHYNLLEKDSQHQAKQKAFLFKAGQNFLYSSILSCTPFLMREFYSTRFLKKAALISTIFFASYGWLMQKPFAQLDAYNRKTAQVNIHKFSVDLEQIEQPAKQQTQKKRP